VVRRPLYLGSPACLRTTGSGIAAPEAAAQSGRGAPDLIDVGQGVMLQVGAVDRRTASALPRSLPGQRDSAAGEGQRDFRHARHVRLPPMLLSDRDLLAEIDAGALGLDPFDASLIQPSSIDVRLDRYFRVFNNSRYTHIDPKVQQDDLTTLVEVDGEDAFVLHPGEFVLGSTFESVTLSDSLAGRLEGKSSLGRLGLLTHSTAGFIDPGFSGHITLELSNVANLPITLWPGMKIGQLCLFRLTSPALHPYGSAEYGSRYQGQRGPTPSRAHLNFRQDDTRR
jgi:dCTP deaminase